MKLAYILIVLFAISNYSCKVKKEIVTASEEKLKNISDSRLVRSVLENSVEFEELYLKKVELQFNLSDHKYNVKANFWLEKDSQIIVSIIPLMGIEMLRVRFTKNEIVIIDRTKKKVINSNYEFIEKNYNVSIDFDVLQAVITNSLFCYSDEIKRRDCIKRFKHYIKDDKYSLQSLKERTFKRIDTSDYVDLIYQEFLIGGFNYKIEKVFIKNFSTNENLEIIYNSFKNLDGIKFPTQININGNRGKNEFSINLEINDIEKDATQKLVFKVPEKYKKATLF